MTPFMLWHTFYHLLNIHYFPGALFHFVCHHISNVPHAFMHQCPFLSVYMSQAADITVQPFTIILHMNHIK